MRALPTLAGVLALVLLTPIAAVAGTVTVSDRRGDAVPRFDITRMRYTNGADSFTSRFRVRDLKGGITQVAGVFIAVPHSDTSAIVYVVRRKDGSTRKRIEAWVGAQEFTPKCPGLRQSWRLGEDVIRVRVPQSCLVGQDGRARRVYTVLGKGNGLSGDPADWTREVRVPFG